MKEIKNFGIISGNAKIGEGKIDFKEIIDKDDNKASIYSADVRTNVNFSNGIIQFKVRFSNLNSGCVLLLQLSTGQQFLAGYSQEAKAFILPNETNYNRAGSLENYDLKEELLLRLEVIGSSMRLYVNEVLMVSGYGSIIETPITFRISGENTLVSEIKYDAIKPKVFIVMQFTPEYNELYNDVILPVCDSFDLECIRADEFYTSTPIIKDIVDSIKNAYIIIAEITPDNPNVFYEIGYAHAINKPTILLCDKRREKLPFDVSGFRTLFYENSIGGKGKVERDLRKFIDSILR